MRMLTPKTEKQLEGDLEAAHTATMTSSTSTSDVTCAVDECRATKECLEAACLKCWPTCAKEGPNDESSVLPPQVGSCQPLQRSRIVKKGPEKRKVPIDA